VCWTAANVGRRTCDRVEDGSTRDDTGVAAEPELESRTSRSARNVLKYLTKSHQQAAALMIYAERRLQRGYEARTCASTCGTYDGGNFRSLRRGATSEASPRTGTWTSSWTACARLYPVSISTRGGRGVGSAGRTGIRSRY